MNTTPVINIKMTGSNISRLRKENKIKIKTMQDVLGFGTPQAIYKWMRGDSLPTLDNLVILADMFHVSISDIVAVTK